MTPVTLNLKAQRWAPFVETPIAFEGYDYSAATFAWAARLYPDAPGSPLISLAGAAAGSEGISCVVTLDADDVPTSWLTFEINEATLEAVLPFAVTDGSPNRKAGSDLVLFHDLQITGGGHVKRRRAQGEITIQPGAVQ
jgi:hypothetical protein